MGNKYFHKVGQEKQRKFYEKEQKDKLYKNLFKQEVKDEFKIMFLGENKIGSKTTLINILLGNKFVEDTETNVCNSYEKMIIDLGNNNKKTFILWDILGQKKYRTLAIFTFSQLDCAVLGYDVTRKETFEEIKKFWLPSLKEKNLDKLVYLLANKMDLYEINQVKREEAIEFAKKENLRFFEISCKTGSGIKEFFEDLKYNLLNK